MAWARMHQRVQGVGDEPVVDEEIFFDAELMVAALEIASPIAVDAMTQREVLGARWRANGIGLDESPSADRLLEGWRHKETAMDREASQPVESEGHATDRSTSTPTAFAWCWRCERSCSYRACRRSSWAPYSCRNPFG